MWGSFPEPVTLVHKSRTVVAINEACRGMREVGMNCAKQGTPEAHRGCLANQALKSGKATYVKGEYAGRKMVSYWLPLNGYPELFVHFGVGITIDYDAAMKQA
ncbi:hypothetical protein SAMN05660742_10145 [Propionispira arboris]|uniref:Uncharacterized protein n=2 Tax=Propionispira TaxID=84034 RepID=A0A1H6TF18_9FIRM|nr:hypothetical protein [Propionispira arboris]SEI78683.1 hypothetical protein SAMN05660742_10145 [Propionispira arboris]